MEISKAFVKKLVAAGVVGFSALSVLAAPVVQAQTQTDSNSAQDLNLAQDPGSEATPGGFWSDEPYEERVSDALYPMPGTFECDNNQNVNCGNPIRYTVQDVDKWETYFRPVPEDAGE